MNTFLVRQSKTPAFWLVLAAIALLLSNGRFSIGIMAWLAPALMLRFARMAPRRVRPWLLAGLISMVACAASWLFVVPFGGLPLLGFFLYSALFARLPYALLPFVADRLLVRRSHSFLSTLVLPLAAVASEALGTLYMRSSWGALAYTQAGNLLLIQLVSIAGMPGITFVVYWFASVANWAAEQGFGQRRAQAGIVAYALVFCLAFVYGGLRIARPVPEGSETIRAASVVDNTVQTFPMEDILLIRQVWTGQAYDAKTLDAVRSRLDEHHERLFALSEEAASAGAELILWPEAGAIVFDDGGREALLARAADLARREQVYMAVGVVRISTDPAASPGSNRLVLFDPSGAMRWEYNKARLIPILEEPYFEQGDGIIPVATTDDGRIGGAICYDVDDPAYLRQAGAQEIDLMLVASGDGPGIARIHQHMATVRAVEQGFSMVRTAENGISTAVDSRGRVMGRLDHLRTGDRLLVNELPVARVTTVYAWIGDAFLWACLAGLAVLVAWSLATNARPRSVPEVQSQGAQL